MFNLALKGADKLAVLGEDRQVEVVVIVGDGDLASRVDAHADRIVGDTFASDLPQIISFVVKDLDAVGTVVRNEDFLPVVNDNSVGELKMLGATELVEDVAVLIEDDHSHHLALYNDDPALVVDCDASGVLQNVGPELANKLTVLVVDLNLVRGRPFCNNDISTSLDYSHSVRVQQLTVSLAHLSKLELKSALLVKYLNPVVVSIRHNNIILCVDGNAAGLRKLTLQNTKLAKLAVVNHLLSLDLRLGRVQRTADVSERRRRQGAGGHELGGQVDHVVGGLLVLVLIVRQLT